MNQARQPAGRPTGGQYATTEHAEAAIELAPGRPEGLNGWPESLPVPTFDVAFGPQGQVKTQVNVPGGYIEVVTLDRSTQKAVAGVHSSELAKGDPRVKAKAIEWAERAHLKFEESIREEMEKAAELARHRVAAEIMGASAPISTASLENIYREASERGWMARRDSELAATSLLARRVQERHPDAAYAELETDYDEHGERYVSALVSYSTNGEYLERVDYYGCVTEGEDDDDDDMDGYGDGDDEVSELMAYISVENVVTRLYHPIPADRKGRGYFIDLHKAADWAPGAEGNL